MSRYWIFAWYKEDGPEGGYHDFQAQCDDVAEAEALAKNYVEECDYHEAHVLDVVEGRMVVSFSPEQTGETMADPKTANIDSETGMRYGVISQMFVSGDFLSKFVPEYGEAYCPYCGGILSAITNEDKKRRKLTKDFLCESCNEYLYNTEIDTEPSCYTYQEEGYNLVWTDVGNIIVQKSPYFALVRPCSPCYPNAGDLDSPDDETGIEAFALGKECFDENPPYILRIVFP